MTKIKLIDNNISNLFMAWLENRRERQYNEQSAWVSYNGKRGKLPTTRKWVPWIKLIEDEILV